MIQDSGFSGFPPRLPGQPFFYPVANEEYATQIARDWNTKDEASGWVGYVLRFRVARHCLEKYPLQIAGSSVHREYWIPAEDLAWFNSQLDGPIEVIARFQGPPRL